MRMSHMMADTTAELLAMADALSLTRWIQHCGTAREHYDVCMSKRKLALRLGAKPLTHEVYRRLLRREVGTL